MADKSPLKATYNGSDTNGLAEFASNDTVAVADGGTGATAASAARSNLGITDFYNTIQEEGSDLTSRSNLNFVGAVVTATDGGGFSDTTTVTIAASPTAGSSSLTTLGTIATGAWEATDIAVAHGGTGASDASTARSNLGITDTTPGGSDTQVQYNNSGAFGGSGNLTFDGSTLKVGTSIAATADTDTTIGFPGSDQLTFNPGGVETIRIGDTVRNGGGEVDRTGRVLLGTTLSVDVEAQASRLQVIGGNTADAGVTIGMFSADAECPRLKFIKSRNTAVDDAHTDPDTGCVQDGDYLGGVQFHAHDGTDYVSMAASMIARVNGSPGVNDIPTDLIFQTCPDGAGSNTEKMRITSSGNVKINDGDLVVGTSGHGIDFSATAGPTAGTGTSELLDDYEEGTWTAVQNVGSGSAGFTVAGRTGSYVKIGRIVHVQGAFVTGSVSSPSGQLDISGLPFAFHTGDDDYEWRAAGSVSLWNHTGDADGIHCFAGSGQSILYIQSQGSNTEANHMQLNTEIRLQITYATN